MAALKTYAKYNSAEDAQYLIDLLTDNSIPYEITKEVNQLDNIYLGDSLDQLFLLRISIEDFSKVNEMLIDQAKKEASDPSFTHYFDQFDRLELLEVVDNPNDWNAYDIEIAKLLLAKRFAVDLRATGGAKYLNTYVPEKMDFKWLVVGYVFSFSIVGVFIGSAVVWGKKTLQNGSSVFLYDENTRWHGGMMIVVGTIGAFLFFAKLIH